MNKLKNYFILFLLVFTFTNNTFAQWYEVSNLPEGWGSEAIDAYDSLIFIGPFNTDTFYLTTSGGENWDAIYKPSFCGDISIIGHDKIWFTNAYSEIFATNDGGLNWQLQYFDPSSTLFMNYIEMFDSLYGIAMGDAPSSTEPTLFLRTTDGGENWLSMNDSSLIGLWSGSVWKRVDFLDENIGYFFSYLDSPNRLYKTTDGGKNWTDLIDSIPCQVVKFYNEKIGIIKSGQCFGNICTSEVHRTTDGGLSWEITSSDTSIGWGQDIEFIPGNPSNVWLAAGNKVFFSSDTGKTWTKELHIPILHYRSGFLDIVFTDENHGWLLGREPGGSNDHLYYTKNGGMGGFVNVDDENEIPQKIYLSQNYPNPFNPTTTIKYQIPERSFVTIKVYDVLGNEIETLVNEEKPIGTYELTWYADNLPSAIYFYRLQAGDFIQTRKMILLR